MLADLIAWLMTIVATSAPSTQDTITIHRAEPIAHRIIFDPKDVPREMPTLNPNEAALTKFHFDCRVRVDADRRAFIDLALEDRIYVPEKVLPALREHEEGHRVINERVYADFIEHAARNVTAEAITRHGTTEEVELEISIRVRAAFLAEAVRAGEEFDRITSHGRGDVRTVDAIEAALKH